MFVHASLVPGRLVQLLVLAIRSLHLQLDQVAVRVMRTRVRSIFSERWKTDRYGLVDPWEDPDGAPLWLS